MSEDKRTTYTVVVHDEGPECVLWAEVLEVPGLFAGGSTVAEVFTSVGEALRLLKHEGGEARS